MEQIQDLLSDLEELLDEREEKQQMLDDETEAGTDTKQTDTLKT